MAFQSVPDTAEVVVRYTYGGQNIVNTFYARYFGEYDLDALQELADVTDAWVTSELKPLLASNLTYVGVDVRGLEFENDNTATANAGAGLGTNAGAVVAPQYSFAIKRLSGLTGRSARGRIYIPPPPASALQADKNFVLAAYADPWVTALEQLTADWATILWTAVIVSRISDGAVRTFGIVFPIIGWEYDNLRGDTQRRRLINS